MIGVGSLEAFLTGVTFPNVDAANVMECVSQLPTSEGGETRSPLHTLWAPSSPVIIRKGRWPSGDLRIERALARTRSGLEVREGMRVVVLMTSDIVLSLSLSNWVVWWFCSSTAIAWA